MNLFVLFGLVTPGIMLVMVVLTEFFEWIAESESAFDLKALMLMMVLLTVMGGTFRFAGGWGAGGWAGGWRAARVDRRGRIHSLCSSSPFFF